MISLLSGDFSLGLNLLQAVLVMFTCFICIVPVALYIGFASIRIKRNKRDKRL